MQKIIHNLRKQPEQTKRHILHIATFIFAGILILLWIYSLGTNVANSDTQAKVQQDLQPLNVLKNNLLPKW